MNYKLRTLNAQFFPQKIFSAPKDIVLGVNNVCNLHCKMCDVGTQNLESNFAVNLVGTHPINMPLELIQKVIEQTATHFPKTRLAYAFTEPLVYPHLMESLAIAKHYKIPTSLTTNALVLKQKAFGILENELDELFVSLDGPQDIHNEIRGNKKSFQKAIEGIELLLESPNCPKINIICAITEWNIGHLSDFVDYFKNLKIHEIGFMHTQFTDEASAQHHNTLWGQQYPATDSNLDEVDLSKVDTDLLSKEIKTIRQKQYPFRIYFSPEIDNLDLLNTYYKEPSVFMGKRCNAVNTSMMVKSDGSVIPAHGRCYNLNIGNAYKSNLKAIWNSSNIAQFRKDLNQAGGLLPACSRCCSGFGK